MNQITSSDDTAQLTGEAETVVGCSARRDFLMRAGVAAGGLALGLAATAAEAQEGAAAPAKAPETVVKLGEHQKLYEVGGSALVDGPAGKVIVVHPDEATFLACAAVCTHKGGRLQYDPKSKQFVCEEHGARFDLAGKVARGPANQPIQSYSADPALVVTAKPAG